MKNEEKAEFSGEMGQNRGFLVNFLAEKSGALFYTAKTRKI